MHDALDLPLVLGLDGDDEPAVADGHKPLLQVFRIRTGGVARQPVAHGALAFADAPADGKQLVGRVVRNDVLRRDGAGNGFFQKIVFGQQAEEFAQYARTAACAVFLQRADRAQQRRDVQQLARGQRRAFGGALNVRGDIFCTAERRL